MLNDGFFDLPSDNPPGSIASVVAPGFAGNLPIDVPMLAGSMGITFLATGDPNMYSVDFTSFSLTLSSFDVAGLSTGTNTGALSPFGSPPVGEYNAVAKEFEIRFEGIYTNALYGASNPMMFFAVAHGVLDESLGEATVGGDDPMIFPLPAGMAPPGQPKLMGAHVLDFDATTGTLSLLENTTLAPNADIAMLRHADASYVIDPGVDPAIGATVVVTPMTYMGQDASGVHNFADTPINIVKNANTLLSGMLRNIALDPSTGRFSADLQVASVAGSSTVLADIASRPGTRTMQIAAGPPAFDILAVTEGFTVSGRMSIPNLFHLGILSLDIPTVSVWGLVAIALFVVTAGSVVILRRRLPAW